MCVGGVVRTEVRARAHTSARAMGAPPALGARVPVEQRRGVDGRPHRDACRPEREDSLACRCDSGEGACRRVHAEVARARYADASAVGLCAPQSAPMLWCLQALKTAKRAHGTACSAQAEQRQRSWIFRKGFFTILLSQSGCMCVLTRAPVACAHRLEHGGRGGNEEQARCQSLYERYRDCKTRLTEAIIADRKSRKASLFDG